MDFTNQKLLEYDDPENHKMVLKDRRMKKIDKIKDLIMKIENKFNKGKGKLKRKKTK